MTAHWRTPSGLHTSPARLPVGGRLPSLDGATGWLNSPPLTAADLQGKIILVNFWTYTCINWLRQLPYLRAWAGKYTDHSLVVIRVHTPEFGFEHELANVRRAVHDMRIDYPVALDNDYVVWSAFDITTGPPRISTTRRAHLAPSLRRRRIPAVGNGHPAAADRGGNDRP